jgi:hypothetical protein
VYGINVKYQFQVDNRSFGSPIRNNWKEAANDAVNAGYAIRISNTSIKLTTNQGATVEKIK